MAWTTAELLTQIRQHAYLPDAHPTYTDAVLLRMADETLQRKILPPLHALRQGWGVAYTDYTVTADKSDYILPSRASFGVVRMVSLLDSSGNPVGPLAALNLEDTEAYQGQTASGLSAFAGFIVVDDAVRLVPTPASTTGTLRVWYYRRPGTLTAASTSADELPHAITSGATTTTLTVGTHGFDNGDLVDVVQANPPFATLAQGVTVSGVTATTLDIPAALSSAATGDYVCTTGQSPVPQVPAELHEVLALGVAVQVLRESGGQDRFQMALEEFRDELKDVLGLMSPRQKGQPERLANAASTLARGTGLRRTVG